MKETQGLSNQELKKKKTRCRDIWKQSRHQHRIKSRRNISLQGESCRDNIKLSRQQLYRKDVATRSSCRDNNCTEKRSQQDQAIATPTSLQTCHNHTEACDKNCDKACDKNCDKNRGRDEGMLSRQHQHTGPIY